MTGRGEGLLARIRQIRRSAAVTQQSPAPSTSRPNPTQALEKRVAHLEQLVEGLQDSVHRETLRHDRRIAELEAQLHPSALSKALSKDARERGL